MSYLDELMSNLEQSTKKVSESCDEMLESLGKCSNSIDGLIEALKKFKETL